MTLIEPRTEPGLKRPHTAVSVMSLLEFVLDLFQAHKMKKAMKVLAQHFRS